MQRTQSVKSAKSRLLPGVTVAPDVQTQINELNIQRFKQEEEGELVSRMGLNRGRSLQTKA